MGIVLSVIGVESRNPCYAAQTHVERSQNSNIVTTQDSHTTIERSRTVDVSVEYEKKEYKLIKNEYLRWGINIAFLTGMALYGGYLLKKPQEDQSQ